MNHSNIDTHRTWVTSTRTILYLWLVKIVSHSECCVHRFSKKVVMMIMITCVCGLSQMVMVEDGDEGLDPLAALQMILVTYL